jgi:steroid 5-alpha reductase family enzyme
VSIRQSKIKYAITQIFPFFLFLGRTMLWMSDDKSPSIMRKTCTYTQPVITTARGSTSGSYILYIFLFGLVFLLSFGSILTTSTTTTSALFILPSSALSTLSRSASSSSSPLPILGNCNYSQRHSHIRNKHNNIIIIMSHRLNAVKKMQAAVMHRNGITNKNRQKQQQKMKTTSTSNTHFKATARTRYSDQPLSSLQRRILEPDPYEVTPLQRIELSSIRGGGGGSDGGCPVNIIPFAEVRHPLYTSMLTFGICDCIGLFISFYIGTHLHLDLIGTGAFAIVSGRYILQHLFISGEGPTSSIPTPSTRTWISSIAVFVWAMKLTVFLTYRAFHVNEDGRLTDLLSTMSGSIQFWFITWIWNVVTSLPYLLALASDARSGNYWTTTLGLILYVVGLSTETIADGQKWIFKQQLSNIPSSGSRFCNVGLWKYSQHPNFVGNLLLWFGIFIVNIPGLVDPLPKPVAANWPGTSFTRRVLWRIWSIRKLLLGSLSPLFLWTLFSGQANGTITSAKALAESKYGDDPAYLKYIQDTPVMFPDLFSFLKTKDGSQEL